MQRKQPKNGIAMTVAACLWLGLFPLLQGGTYATLTHDKWVISLILTAVTLLCFGTDLLLRHSGVPRPVNSARAEGRAEKSPLSAARLPFCIAALLLLWTVLSCVLSPAGPDTWWIGKNGRYEGLLTELCYFVLFGLFLFSRVRLKPVVLSAAAGVTVLFVIILLQRGGGNPLGLYPGGRSFALNPEFQGTIGNVDMGTGLLLMLSGLFLHSLPGFFSDFRSKQAGRKEAPSSKGKRLVLLQGALCMIPVLGLIISLYLIITMDVQFGVITLGVLFLVTLFRFLPKKFRLPLLLLLLVLALLAVWFWPGHSGGVWELHETLHGRARLSFGSNRLAVWQYSLGLAGESARNLLFGGGSATFMSRFNAFLSQHNYTIPREQDGVRLPDFFDNPHNIYIAWLTDHGLPAMLLFIALLGLALFRKREKWLPVLTPWSAPVLCYAVQGFFAFSVCIVAPLFWVFLGLAMHPSEA